MENIEEYVELTLDCIFNQSVNLQLQAFKKGFNSVIPIEGLRSFEYHELENLVCGELMNDSDWAEDKLLQFFSPAHGFNKSNPNYQNFIKYLVELEKNKR